MGLAAGTRLGPYEIVAVVGAGGMGEVYRARDTRLKRGVVLKSCRKNVVERRRVMSAASFSAIARRATDYSSWLPG